MDQDKAARYLLSWREDWNRFVRDVLKARLDKEQQAIVTSVQFNPMTAVASGTARGKDFVSACVCLCFLYLTPRWDKEGNLVKNTKVAMTAPTSRQVSNIMSPEIRRLFRAAKVLPGRLVYDDIRTNYSEWFLTGFKAGDDNMEAWSGFHAANTMFAVTEASGLSDVTFNAIEGNLQGNSRLLIVFNPNVSSGYAAKAMMSNRFSKFRLSSLNAENVVAKKEVIPGQVNYDWVADKVDLWCERIQESDFNEGEGDFRWEGSVYRPNDLFRVKVLGMFPKVSEDCLIPYEWVALANKKYEAIVETHGEDYIPDEDLHLGVDVAGMGRDSSFLAPRYGNFMRKLRGHQSAGKADHMKVAGMVVNELGKCLTENAWALIDTIGEGAGVFSRLQELGIKGATSCKFSEGPNGNTDITGQYSFANMKAFLYWSMRDWLNPKNGYNPALPPDDLLTEEMTAIKWHYTSSGSIIMEPKDELKKRIGRSPDRLDSVANTFYPVHKEESGLTEEEILEDFE